MSATRAKYFLRKALYVRAILNFAEAAEFKYLNFIATNWLRFTANDDTEFAYAREVFGSSSLDRAYDNFGKKKFDMAANFFYGSLSLTDDLESHAGYLRSMVLKGERGIIDARYDDLKKHEFIEDNLKFVRALLLVLDADTAAVGNPLEMSRVNKALDLLEGMTQDRDSSVRYLFLGYCYLSKLLWNADGYDFDRGLFEAAHRSLMLALDLGRDNIRIQAAALTNLGVLHQRVQNHGLAVKFFAKRKVLGFSSQDEAVRLGWLYARSLFYNNQADKAADEMEAVLSLQPTVVAFRERLAFYLQAAERFERAAQLYEKLLDQGAIGGDLNLAKLQLAYGYCLYKMGHEKRAQTALNQAWTHARRIPKIPRGKDRLVDFDPRRIQANAFGLLSRLGSTAERLDALEARAALLEQAPGLYEDGQALSILVSLRRADLLWAGDRTKAAQELRKALRSAEALGDAGKYNSHAVFRAAVAYLLFGVKHPQQVSREDGALAQKIVEKCVGAYHDEIFKQPQLEFQKLKLSLLWSAYNAKVMGVGSFDARVEQKKIENSKDLEEFHAKQLLRLAEAL